MSPRSSPARKAVDPALVTALESHIKTLQGENEALKEQLATAEARADKQTAEFAARDTERVADLAAERARTEKAINAFADLARQLNALAASRARPWWRRLAG